MVQKASNKTGVSENWVQTNGTQFRKADADKNLKKAKQRAIGKQYIRVPHPTLKNTYILKEKE